MRQLLVVSDGEHFVCYRYRWAAFAPALAAAGWRLEHMHRPRGGAEFMRTLQAIAAADAVVIQRQLFSCGKAWLIRHAARTLLYDFDDAVHLRDSNSGRTADDPVRWSRFRRMVRMADASLAGSPQLVEQAVRAAPNARVLLVPTCVDPRGYAPAAHDRPAGGPEMVWIGSRSTAAARPRSWSPPTTANASVSRGCMVMQSIMRRCSRCRYSSSDSTHPPCGARDEATQRAIAGGLIASACGANARRCDVPAASDFASPDSENHRFLAGKRRCA